METESENKEAHIPADQNTAAAALKTVVKRRRRIRMLLGGTIAGQYANPAEWEEALALSGFKAVTAPFSCDTPRDEIRAYCDIIGRHRVRIAEIGVWRNLLDPDAEKAKAAWNTRKASWSWRTKPGFPAV